MIFTVRYECNGRFGNVVFLYTLCVIYQLLGYTYINTPSGNEVYIDDNMFVEIFNEKLFKDKTLPIFNCNIVFTGYFQHDYIIKYFKEQVLKFIRDNPTQKLNCGIKDLMYNNTMLTNECLPSLELDDNDIVIHVRLEDKLTNENITDYHCVMSPNDYDIILNSIKYNKIYWVMNKPTTEFEHKYINYLLNKWGGIYKEQSLEEDFYLMRKIKTIICSISTLSWVASAFSINDQIVYLPKNHSNHKWLTFSKPHNNTYIYNYTPCTLQRIENILGD